MVRCGFASPRSVPLASLATGNGSISIGACTPITSDPRRCFESFRTCVATMFEASFSSGTEATRIGHNRFNLGWASATGSISNGCLLTHWSSTPWNAFGVAPSTEISDFAPYVLDTLEQFVVGSLFSTRSRRNLFLEFFQGGGVKL